MYLLENLLKYRAEAKEKILNKAREHCKTQIDDIEFEISGLVAKRENADIKSVKDAINSSINKCRSSQDVWGNTSATLAEIETIVSLLFARKKYWTIVKAIPYKKLKENRFTPNDIDILYRNILNAYNELKNDEIRIEQKNSQFIETEQHINDVADSKLKKSKRP